MWVKQELQIVKGLLMTMVAHSKVIGQDCPVNEIRQCQTVDELLELDEKLKDNRQFRIDTIRKDIEIFFFNI